jgi:hypothetical protein
MSDKATVQSTDNVGATGSDQVAAKTSSVDDAGENQESKKEVVSRETYTRVLSKLKKLEDAFEAKQKDEEIAKQKILEEQGQWKSAFELEKKQRTEIETRLNQKDKMITDSIKMNAFLKQLPGTVSDEYWDLIKLDEIVIDPETQKPDPVALENYAKQWSSKHSRLIDKVTTAKVPADAPKQTNLGNVNLTVADMAKRLAGLKL